MDNCTVRSFSSFKSLRIQQGTTIYLLPPHSSKRPSLWIYRLSELRNDSSSVQLGGT
jgi:hypothetical protein